MSEEIKESYLKLPIEYVEFYEKDLKQQIEDLQQKVEQLENIRKEAIEWCKCVINSKTTAGELPNGKRTDMGYCLDLAEPLLKILEWGKDERQRKRN